VFLRIGLLKGIWLANTKGETPKKAVKKVALNGKNAKSATKKGEQRCKWGRSKKTSHSNLVFVYNMLTDKYIVPQSITLVIMWNLIKNGTSLSLRNRKS
jgi:hypothetical protein